MLGYQPTENDDGLIDFEIKKASALVRGFCNIEDFPEDLDFQMCDYVAGQILWHHQRMGDLGDGFDVGQAAKSISVGSTSVSLDGKSNAELFEDLLAALKDKLSEKSLLPYRRLYW